MMRMQIMSGPLFENVAQTKNVCKCTEDIHPFYPFAADGIKPSEREPNERVFNISVGDTSDSA